MALFFFTDCILISCKGQFTLGFLGICHDILSNIFFFLFIIFIESNRKSNFDCIHATVRRHNVSSDSLALVHSL